MGNGDITKTSNFVRTWWGPLVGIVAVVGSFYQLDGKIANTQQALESHCASSEQALTAHIEASNADTRRIDKEILRIDQFGTRQLSDVGSNVKSMQVQITQLQSTNVELKQSLKRIEDYLMKGPVIQ